MDSIKLSKDIKGIINKYLNISYEIIQKIINKNRQKWGEIKFKNKDITLLDIILSSNQIGYDGFYIMKTYYNSKLIDKLIELYHLFKLLIAKSLHVNKLILKNLKDEVQIFIINESGINKTIICNIEILNIMTCLKTDL